MAKSSIDPKARAKAIDAAIASIERQFGKGSILRMNEDAIQAIPIIPTGSLTLDRALGIGGFPRGRVVEIYGPEASGKTTLTLHAIAECQKAGGVAAFIDAEHALDTLYARNLGVKVDELLISQPDSGEQALEITDTLVRTGALDMIIIDSVAALVPKQELDGDMGDIQVGAQARLMSKAMRKITSAINKSSTTVIFINQLRMKIGVMFGSPEVTSGGNALKFYSSVRLDIRRTGSLKKGSDVLGNSTRVKVVKNKLAPPFKQVEFDIMYGKGISQSGELIDLGLEAGFVSRSGSWYSVRDNRIAQGRDNAKQYLEDNPEIYNTLLKDLRAHFGFPGEEDEQ